MQTGLVLDAKQIIYLLPPNFSAWSQKNPIFLEDGMSLIVFVAARIHIQPGKRKRPSLWDGLLVMVLWRLPTLPGLTQVSSAVRG